MMEDGGKEAERRPKPDTNRLNEKPISFRGMEKRDGRRRRRAEGGREGGREGGEGGKDDVLLSLLSTSFPFVCGGIGR